MASRPFKLLFTRAANEVIQSLREPQYEAKRKKVFKALGLLQTDPRHPGLQSHKMQSLKGPGGEEVWQVYVENRTPGAWRIWYVYGPERGQISIVYIGPHPD